VIQLGIFSWLLGSENAHMRDKIIFTQKHRVTALEKEVSDMRNEMGRREDDINRTRESFEKSKERLVEQIIQLSDKFAEINQRMLDIAHENTRLKMIVDKGNSGNSGSVWNKAPAKRQRQKNSRKKAKGKKKQHGN
jgi:hypothetical protein